MKKHLIGITMGDPAGVGPELCLHALTEPKILQKCRPVIFGDASVLERVATICRLPFSCRVIPVEQWLSGVQITDTAAVVDCQAIEAGHILPGRVNPACGSASYRYIETAVHSAMCGMISAIATAPINKESLNLAGLKYPGHTEILARLTGTNQACMMMASDEIKVSLVTTHASLASVPKQLSTTRILEVIKLTADTIKRLGRFSPRITVCALNPHAGEHGLFGKEEKKIIEPAIQQALEKGLQVVGPVAPDTAFLAEKRRKTDAYVVMYHDQGLIPFKMLAFDKGVNITLGLPIVRTSVDHGTAFDIAWKDKASANSLIQSVLWALKLI